MTGREVAVALLVTFAALAIGFAALTNDEKARLGRAIRRARRARQRRLNR